MSCYIVGPEWDRRVVEVIPRENDAIVMSGGLDSYVLYNLLSKPKIFNIKRKDNFDNSDQIRNLTGADVIEVDEVTTDSTERLQQTVHKIMDEYDIGMLYCGLNHTPPLEYFPEFDTEAKPNRPWRIDHPKFKTPFLHIYKYHIIDLGNQLNLDLNKTQSCLWEIYSHCGECWQCKERQWGFDQLKKN
jgi:hypothetical protein